jgi:hypothetical protein
MIEGNEQPGNRSAANDATVIDGEETNSPALPLPETIGDDRIKKTIVAGGLGTVCLPQQDNPKRDVSPLW